MADLYDGRHQKVIPDTKIDNVLNDFNQSWEYNVVGPRMKGINHRGYSTDAPENTLPSYLLSYRHGFKYVECDISYTSDNIPVLLHDSTIDRTSNGTGNINSLTFAQVREYDFGSWKSSEYTGTQIPSLAEFLSLCRNLGLHPYLELKNTTSYTTAQIQNIVDMVYAYGLKGAVTYISFSNQFLATIKNYDQSARLGYVVSSISATTISNAEALQTAYNEVFIDSSSYGSTALGLCKDANIPLEVWTINNKTTIEGLDDYISGVTSDSQNAGKIKLDQTLSE